MSEEHPDRFFDLAMMKIAGQASDAELAELDGLLLADTSLQDEYKRLAAESQLLKELLPLAEATQATEGEFPEWARLDLQKEVKEELGRPVAEEPWYKFWERFGRPNIEQGQSTVATDWERQLVHASPPPVASPEPSAFCCAEPSGFNFWAWGLGLSAACAVVVLVVLNTGTEPGPRKEVSPIIQIAVLDVAGASRGGEDSPEEELQKAWPGKEVKWFSDPAKIKDQWLQQWPVDAKGPVVKIYYVVSTGELKVIGETAEGKTIEKAFLAGEDLPGTLAKAKKYLKEIYKLP